MNIYPLLKPLLFQLDAEQAHDLTLQSLKRAEKLGLLALAAGRLPGRWAPQSVGPSRLEGCDS